MKLTPLVRRSYNFAISTMLAEPESVASYPSVSLSGSDDLSDFDAGETSFHVEVSDFLNKSDLFISLIQESKDLPIDGVVVARLHLIGADACLSHRSAWRETLRDWNSGIWSDNYDRIVQKTYDSSTNLLDSFSEVVGRFSNPDEANSICHFQQSIAWRVEMMAVLLASGLTIEEKRQKITLLQSRGPEEQFLVE